MGGGLIVILLAIVVPATLDLGGNIFIITPNVRAIALILGTLSFIIGLYYKSSPKSPVAAPVLSVTGDDNVLTDNVIAARDATIIYHNALKKS